MFKANDQVLAKKKMLRGSISEVKRGMVVAATADRVSVAFPGEMKPVEFPVDQVSLAKDSFGPGANVNDPREKPVVKMYR